MPPSSGKAQLFVDVEYGGAYATLETGTYNIGDGTGSVGDNSVSSLKVASGYQITVYTDRDCQGTSMTITGDSPRLEAGFLNDEISSARVEPIPKPQPAQQVVFVQPPSY